jgi:hypothetical protein
MSPTFKVPFSTKMLVTYPLPLSKEDSRTVPCAALSGFALSSNNSASNNTFSSKSSTPTQVLADISCEWYLPPHSSTNKFMVES